MSIDGMALHRMPNGTEVAFDEARHRYYLVTDTNLVPLESVTQTLGVCPKPGLPWWGMKVGVAGALKLHELGEFEREVDGRKRPIDQDEAVDLLTVHRLTVNHVRDEAGQRGTDVHDVAEGLVSGELPSLDDMEDDRRGYAEALICAWLDLAPEPIAAEVVVCSTKHGVAGKFDLRARIPEGREAVVDVESGWKRPVPSGEWLLDYKTSSGVYDSHALQLEAYDGLGQESGYPACDDCGVIRLCPDGRYELIPSWATWDDYMAALAFHRSLERMKALEPRRPRKCQRGDHYFAPIGRERICDDCRGTA